MAKTKIVVIQMKELIYTAIFAGLAILLIVLLIVMFHPFGENDSPDSKTAGEKIYQPGVYTSRIELGDSTLNLEVVVDSDQVKSVSLVNLEESTATMYPLVRPSLESIEKELISGKSPDEIALSEKSRYTETLLLEGIKTALNKALPNV